MENLRICVSRECNNQTRIIKNLDDIDIHYMHNYMKMVNFLQDIQQVYENIDFSGIQKKESKFFIKNVLDNIKDIRKQLDDLEREIEGQINQQNCKFLFNEVEIVINKLKQSDLEQITKNELDLVVTFLQDGPEKFLEQTNDKSEQNLIEQITWIQQIALRLLSVTEMLKKDNQTPLLEQDINLTHLDYQKLNSEIQQKDLQINFLTRQITQLTKQLRDFENKKRGDPKVIKNISLSLRDIPRAQVGNIINWSNSLKSPKNILVTPTITQCQGSKWECAAWLTLSETNLQHLINQNENNPLNIRCRFNAIISDDVAIGICIKEIVDKQKYTTSDEMESKYHGCYMMTCKGRIYSHHDSNINCKKNGFPFGINEILTIILDDKSLTLTNGIKSFTMITHYEKSYSIHLATQLTGKGDQVEIVNN